MRPERANGLVGGTPHSSEEEFISKGVDLLNKMYMGTNEVLI